MSGEREGTGGAAGAGMEHRARTARERADARRRASARLGDAALKGQREDPLAALPERVGDPMGLKSVVAFVEQEAVRIGPAQEPPSAQISPRERRCAPECQRARINHF